MTLRLRDISDRVLDEIAVRSHWRVNRVWLSRWGADSAHGTHSAGCGRPCRAECVARWLGGRACGGVGTSGVGTSGIETSGIETRPPGGESP